jgi:MFS family permease
MVRRVLFNHYVSIAIFTLGYGSFQSFVPVFALSFGATYTDIGLIGAATAGPTIVMPLLMGFLADRFNRLGLFLITIGFNVVTTAMLFFSGSTTDILIARALGGAVYAIYWPAAEIMISELSSPDERVRVFGEYSVAFAIGFAAGPYMGGFISDTWGINNLFIFSSVLIMASLAWSLATFVPKYKKDLITRQTHTMKFSTPPLRMLAPIYLIAILANLGFGTVVMILPGYMKNIGTSTVDIGLTYTLLGLIRMLAYQQAYKVARLGEVRALGVSGILLTAALLAIPFARTSQIFILIMLPLGIATALFFPLTLAPASRPFPPEKQGFAIGLYESIAGIGWTVGPFATGLLSEAVDPASPYLMLALVNVLMIPTLLVQRRIKITS